MSELDEIKTKIVESERKLKKAEEDGASEARLVGLQAMLTSLLNILNEHLKKENLLLAGSGN
jgi:hypothetical protein